VDMFAAAAGVDGPGSAASKEPGGPAAGSQPRRCEHCGAGHSGAYGSGRFCCGPCMREWCRENRSRRSETAMLKSRLPAVTSPRTRRKPQRYEPPLVDPVAGERPGRQSSSSSSNPIAGPPGVRGRGSGGGGGWKKRKLGGAEAASALRIGSTPANPGIPVRIGDQVRKDFPGFGYYGGTVKDIRRVGKRQEVLYLVEYEDGDAEECTEEDISNMVFSLRRFFLPSFQFSTTEELYVCPSEQQEVVIGANRVVPQVGLSGGSQPAPGEASGNGPSENLSSGEPPADGELLDSAKAAPQHPKTALRQALLGAREDPSAAAAPAAAAAPSSENGQSTGGPLGEPNQGGVQVMEEDNDNTSDVSGPGSSHRRGSEDSDYRESPGG